MMDKKRFGEEEKQLLNEVIDSDNLFYVNGEKTKAFENAVKSYYGTNFSVLTSSGTGALHAAVAALEIPPGREIITSPITDMGTVIGALYQNLIPVFADVDPHTYNLTAETIEQNITDRTAAIIVVHLAGNPAEMDEILALAEAHHIPVIEDCAQSHGARYKNRKIGTMGDMGCFSLNAFKHISAGDGGFVITNDEHLHEKLTNYADKYYDRLKRGHKLEHLAPCYRITELQAAVGLAQMDKLDNIITSRNKLGTRFNQGIANLQGIHPHYVHAHNFCTYWFTMICVDDGELGYPRDHFSTVMTFEGVPASRGYIDRPLYLEKLFVEKAFFPGGVWPAAKIAGLNIEYKEGDCPVAEEVLRDAIRISISEFQTPEEIDAMIEGIQRAHEAALEGEL